MGDACLSLGGLGDPPPLSFGGISRQFPTGSPHDQLMASCPTLNCSDSMSLVLKLEYAIPPLRHKNPDPAGVVVSRFTTTGKQVLW